jgi:hypothetical protein
MAQPKTASVVAKEAMLGEAPPAPVFASICQASSVDYGRLFAA